MKHWNSSIDVELFVTFCSLIVSDEELLFVPYRQMQPLKLIPVSHYLFMFPLGEIESCFFFKVLRFVVQTRIDYAPCVQ